MINDLRRLIPASAVTAILFAAIIVLVFLTSFSLQQWDTDIFWAIASGEWIVKNLSVPKADIFSFTFSGQPWVDFTWGFQVIVYLLFTYLGGWYALAVLQFLVLAGTFYLLYRNLSLVTNGRGWLCIFLLCLVFMATYDRFFIRPHIFGFLFITAYLYILNLYEARRISLLLLVLLPLQVLWVNIHSSFVLGIFLVGVYAIFKVLGFLTGRGGASGSVGDEGRPSSSLSRSGAGGVRGPGVMVIVSLLVPLVSLINPYGLELVLFPFIHQGGENADALNHIAEWMHVPVAALLFNFYPFNLVFLGYKLLFFMVFLALIYNLRRLNPRDMILAATFAYMSFGHIRWMALFALVAAPVLASNFALYLDERGWRGSAFKGYGVALALLFVILLGHNIIFTRGVENLGVGLKYEKFPIGTVKYIKDKGIKGEVFNGYDLGGYLIYEGIRPAIDGRTPTVYSPYYFWKTRRIAEAGGWQKYQAEYPVEMALVRYGDVECAKVEEDPGWAPVMLDDISVLFVRNIPQNKALIKDNVLGGDKVCSLDKEVDFSLLLRDDNGDENLKALVAKFSEVAEYYESVGLGDKVAIHYKLRGHAGLMLGGDYTKQALEDFKKALTIIDEPSSWYFLGVAESVSGKPHKGIVSFKKAASGGFDKGMVGLGGAYYEMGKYADVVKVLTGYVSTYKDKADDEALEKLGLACFELEDYRCAQRYLRRAAYASDDPLVRAKLYFYAGNASLELGETLEATAYYRSSIVNDPNYRGGIEIIARTLREGSSPEVARQLTDMLDTLE